MKGGNNNMINLKAFMAMVLQHIIQVENPRMTPDDVVELSQNPDVRDNNKYAAAVKYIKDIDTI